MKRTTFVVFLVIFCFSCLQLPAGERDILKEVNQLTKKKEYSKALALIDKELSEQGESAKLLAAKLEILMKLERYEDALKTAVKRADASERKSPWHCLDIVAICVKLKDTDNAFAWLNKAVDRGFLSYTELDDEAFAPLKKDKRFNKVIQTVKDKIGIGKPAKDFTVKLLSGETFTLSKQKGKVVLIDFWATWCPPCVKGIPHIKEFYREHKGKGFEVIGISLDSDRKAVDDYIAKEKLEWPIVFSGAAWQDKTARYYNVNLIPSYWLIDRNGILRDFGIPLRDKETMKKAIEKLVHK
jgi:peroxiredoxin